MWLIVDRDKTRAERIGGYLQKQGFPCILAASEQEIPWERKDAVSVALLSDGWSAATVAKLRNDLNVSVLLYLTQQVSQEQYAALVHVGYADVISFPPNPKQISPWERKEAISQTDDPLEVLLGQAARKNSYTSPKETVEFSGHTAPRKALVLAFTGVKGGVGKSTMSILFAQGFLSQKKRVVVVELDPNGSLSVLLKMDRVMTTDRFETLPDTLSDHELEQSMLRHPSGMWVIPRGERPLGLSSDGTERIIHLTAQYADVVILDCNALPIISTHLALQEADAAYCVTTQDRSGWNEIPSLMCKIHGPAWIILNRVKQRPRKALAIRDFLQKQAGFQVSGIVREDKILFDRVQQGLAVLGSKQTMETVQKMIHNLMSRGNMR